MYSTVLIENAILLVVCGYAFQRHGKLPYLILLIVNVAYMAFDNVLFNRLNVTGDHQDNMLYYLWLVVFFIVAFFVFVARLTKINLILGGCMLTQAFMCFAMGINGAHLNEVYLPEYDIVYDIQRVVNSLVWVVEISTLLNVEILRTWNAATTSKG